MPYTMRFRGQEVICDSPEEVAALAGLETGHVTRGRQNTTSGLTTIRSAIESLNSQQKQIVIFLNKAGLEPVTDEELRGELQIQGNKKAGNKKLAGILAGISKGAKRAGINPMLKHESIRGTTGDRVHRYWLEDDVRSALNGGK